MRQITYRVTYGRSLIQFQPSFSTAMQVGKVTVRGWNNVTKEAITATVTRAELATGRVGAGEDEDPGGAFRNREEVITNQPVATKEEAHTLARETLERIAKETVTGTGSVVGLPDLRSGTVLELDGVGSRFSGRFFVTETTHTIGDGGYTTQFTCRREELQVNENDTNGIVIGVVCSLEDPDNLGRVQVEYPHLDNKRSDWIRMVNTMAGAGRGAFFRPETGDEVLVCWEHNDGRRAHILGGLWSKKDKPPRDDGKAKENNWRFIKSRSGHILKFDDTKDAEKIEILDKDGRRKVVIDSKNKKVQIVCDGDIEITSSSGNVAIKGKDVTVSASGKLALNATGTATLKGQTVNLNPPGA